MSLFTNEMFLITKKINTKNEKKNELEKCIHKTF